MGGKSKSTTVGYHYRPAFHVGLVGRMIDAFLEYRAADKTAWAGELTASGRIQIDAPDLFGGEKDQGGIVGPVDVMFGEPDQMPNPYLVEVFGNQTVAWRGMTTLAFCGGRFGAMNPYQQKSAYKIRKIKAGWDGDWGDDPCWYPETAEIPLYTSKIDYSQGGWSYKVELPGSDADYSSADYDHSSWSVGRGGFGSGGPGAGLGVGTYIPAGVVGKGIWLRREVPADPGVPVSISFYHDDGGWLWWNGEPIPLTGTADHLHSRAVIQGARVKSENIVAVQVLDSIPTGNPSNIYAGLDITQAEGLIGINPAHLLFYVRTDTEKGAEPVTNINDASLRSAADRLFDEGFGLCQVVYDPQQDTADSFTERICRIIGGSFERSLEDGQWHLDLARGDYEVSSLPIIDDDDILELRRQPTTLHGVTNSLAVRYFDPIRKESVITPAVRALGLIRVFGEIHEVLDFPEIADGRTAVKVADRELRARITPSEAFELVTRPRPELLALRRSQYFRLQSPKRGIGDMVCIVGEKDIGTLRSGALRWKVAQDIYGYADAAYIEVEHGVDVRPPQMPALIDAARAFEAPYIDMVASLPRAELEALPDDVGYLAAVAARPAHGLDYTIAVQPAAGEYAVAASGEWCPTATTAEAIPESAEPLVVPLDQVRGLDRVPLGAGVLIGDEICRLDDKSLDPPQVTLARGCADTVPMHHPAGARLWFLGEDMAIDVTEYSAGETVSVKFLSNSGSQQLPLDAAPPHVVPFVGRQARPYPPAGLLVNGQAYPDPDEPLSGVVELEWLSRDRLLQADQLIDQTVPSIGPEPGATVTVEYRNEDGTVLIDNEVGITGEVSTPWAPPQDGRYRIEVFSELNGIESLQRQCRTVLVGAVLWEPSYLSQPLDIWLDWDSAVDEASGAAATIYDRSGRGRNFHGGGGTANPQVIEAGLAGHRILRFDGANDYMHSTGAQQGALFRQVGAGWWLSFVRNRSPADRIFFDVRFSNASAMIYAALQQDGCRSSIRRVLGETQAAVTTPVPNNEWHSRMDVVSWQGGFIQQYVDGELRAGATLTSSGLTQDTQSGGDAIGLGNRPMNLVAGEYPDMDLFALVVGADWIPETAERQRLEGWVHHGADLHTLLPADHPFRHVPPYLKTPELQPSFTSSPVVFGFVAATDAGDVGVAAGPAVASEFGTLLAPAPTLGAAQGLTVAAAGGDISIRLDGISLPAVRAVVMTHTGAEIVEIILTDLGDHYAGSAAGDLEDGSVYYVQLKDP